MVENQENQSHPGSDGSGFLFGNAGQMRILRRSIGTGISSEFTNFDAGA